LKNLAIEGKIILKYISRKMMVSFVLDSYGLGLRQVVKLCECGNEHSGYIKCRKVVAI
jgi:hypothetical protein